MDYPEKVWGIPTIDILAEWAPQRLTIRNNIQPFYTKAFVAVGTKGTGSIFQYMVDVMSNDPRFKLNLRSRVHNLELANNKISKLITSSGVYDVEGNGIFVVSTLPATVLGKMLDVHINLRFRGIRSLYLFFKNSKVLPAHYNWLYVSDPAAPFNRITEPTSMTRAIAPNGYTYICVESTYSSPDRQDPLPSDFDYIYNCYRILLQS